MFKVLGIATICAFCATPALAKKGAETAQRTVAPMRDNFDLATIPCEARISLVPLAGLEPALQKKLDFESSASTNSATGALGRERGG